VLHRTAGLRLDLDALQSMNDTTAAPNVCASILPDWLPGNGLSITFESSEGEDTNTMGSPSDKSDMITLIEQGRSKCEMITTYFPNRAMCNRTHWISRYSPRYVSKLTSPSA
jgi:hypothetical protein